jgi:hypothetical protein
MGKTEVIAAVVAAAPCPVWTIVEKCDLAAQIAAKIRDRVRGRSVGILDGTRKEGDAQVVVATAQTVQNLSAKDVAHVGIFVFDEVHHVPAATVAKVAGLGMSRGLLGLTATPRRSDGFEFLIDYAIGPCVFRVKRPFTPACVRALDFRLGPRDRQTLRSIARANPGVHGDVTLARNALVGLGGRNAALLDAVRAIAVEVKRNDPRGRVLIMLDRREHAMRLCEAAGGVVSERAWRIQARHESKRAGTEEHRVAFGVPFWDQEPSPSSELGSSEGRTISHGLYIGSGVLTAEEKRTALEDADVLWTTASMAYEGLDAKHVHAVVLACKCSDCTQHMGRGLRLDTMALLPFFLLWRDAKFLHIFAKMESSMVECSTLWDVQMCDTLDSATSRPWRPSAARIRSSTSADAGPFD